MSAHRDHHIARPRLLCVGLGSSHGDDQLGWAVADVLREWAADHDDIDVRHAGTPIDLLHWLEGVDDVYLCDAISSQEPPGTMHRYESDLTADDRSKILPELQRLRVGGTHQIGLPAVLDLAATLGCLPQRLIVYGVTGRDFSPGQSPSAPLQAVVPEVALTMWKDINARAVASPLAADSG
ncbi:MAG: hydrogenase maturation protease [Planctomycetaceae bacterium]|nr:hydrogenase maturation protease [Planctomycetaceae bacterium]